MYTFFFYFLTYIMEKNSQIQASIKNIFQKEKLQLINV